LKGEYSKCVCGKYTKVDSKWCSVSCRNKTKKYNTNLELLRFCNKLEFSVIGGFSKLLSAMKHTVEYSAILTFADLRFFNGSIYDKFGEYLHTTDPGYYWITPSKIKRLTRYSTQKHKLCSILGEGFDSSKTEEENMIDNGYTKIYDCGNLVFLL
jgi:hypothetical protein